MKKILLLLVALSLFAGNVICQISLDLSPEQKLKLLKEKVTDNLHNNILSFWSAKMPDDVNGGFYGRIDRNNKVIPDAAKGGILNARILWTYSAAYRVTGNPEYLKLATRAKYYILANFIDR